MEDWEGQEGREGVQAGGNSRWGGNKPKGEKGREGIYHGNLEEI